MFITGLGTAAPPQRYTQAQCWDALQRSPQFAQLGRGARTRLQNVLLRDDSIQTRSLAARPLERIFTTDADTLHRHYAEHAPALASQAATAALRQACLPAGDIDAVIISTCTGYLCPGLSSYVVQRLGLRPDVLALDLVGQGCGAALPNLATADALLAARRCAAVLSICVEVCSAAFYLDDDRGVLVSACLFSDGAGAAVLARGTSRGTRAVEWIASGSLHDASQRDALRFEQKNGLLRNILTPPVPQLAAQHANRVLASVLEREGVSRHDIAAWIMHAGGRRVLQALQDRLCLAPGDLDWSRGVLGELGNLSSPFVLFVLQAALRRNAPSGWWWMSSFGAGFSCHGALLRVT